MRTKKTKAAEPVQPVPYNEAVRKLEVQLDGEIYKADILAVFKALFQNHLTFGYPQFLGMTGALRDAYDLSYDKTLGYYDKWVNLLLDAKKIVMVSKLDYPIFCVLNHN